MDGAISLKIAIKRITFVAITAGCCIVLWVLVIRQFYPASYKNLRDYVELYGNLLGNEAPTSKKVDNIVFSRFIAHAGGAINELTYTNSKEALNESYSKGRRFIELDFELTVDGHVVLLHDWKITVQRLFDTPARRYNLREFRQFNMIGNLHQMDLNDLFEWLRRYPDVYIVTDIKTNNLKILKTIKEHYSDAISRFIPQIYYFREYVSVRKLGYQAIILTLYRSNYADDLVFKFAETYGVDAVTMPEIRGQGQLPERLKAIGVLSFVHTINDFPAMNRLIRNHVYGVYTDTLFPESGTVRQPYFPSKKKLNKDTSI